MTLDVYTVGGLPWISQALKGIVLILGNSSYHTALKVTLLWSLIIGTIIALKRANIFPLSYLIASFFLFHGFYSAKVDVNVIDTKLGENYIVTDVPFGVGVVTSMFSMLGYTLTNLIDQAFHTGTTLVYGISNSYIEDMDYQKTGYLGSLNYFSMTKFLEFADPETYRRTMAYLSQCYIPYVSSLTESELNTILKEKDLYSSGKLEVPINLIMNYDGKSWYCKDFYRNMLVPKINDFLSNVTSDPTIIGFSSTQEINAYKSVINALTNASYSITTAVSQPAVINAIKSALVSFSADSDEFNKKILSAYLVGEAEGRFQLMARALGDLARDLIPSLAIAMQFLIIVASSTIALLFLLPQSQNAFWRFVKLSAWVYFWGPALATLDALAKVSTIYKIHSALAVTGTNGLTIASIGKTLSEADQVSAIAGYLALSVPGIAWLLLQGSEYVVASLTQSIMGRATQRLNTEEAIKASTAERVGYETTGTIGEGFQVRSALFANPTSMANVFGSAVAGTSSAVLQGSYLGGIADTAMGAGAGMATYRAHDGSTSAMMETGALTKGIRAHVTPEGIVTQRPTLDGGIVYQNFQKRFDGNLFQAQLTDVHRKVLSQKLSQVYQELQSLTTENAMSTQAGYEEFAKFEDAVLNQYRDGAEYTKVLETSEAESLKEMKQIRDSLEKALGIDEQTATRVTNDLAAKLSFDANFGRAFADAVKKGNIRKVLDLIGPSLEDKIDVSKIDMAALTKTAKDLAEFTESKGYEKVLSALHKFSMNDSIAHSFASSYQKQEGESIDLTKARSYSERIASSLHRALSYEKQEQLLGEKGDSFSIDLSQQFIEWYAKKTGFSLEVAHENLNRMAAREPLNLEILATEFSKEYADRYKISDKGLPEKVMAGIKQANQELAKKPEDFYIQKKHEIEGKAVVHGVDNSLQEELRRDFESAEKKFKGTYQATKDKIRIGEERISPDNLPSWSELHKNIVNLAPDNAFGVLHSNRWELLYNSLTDEKFILGGTALANADVAYELAKRGWPYITRAIRAAGANPLTLGIGSVITLGSIPFIAHEEVQKGYVEKLQQAIQSKEIFELDKEQVALLPNHLKPKFLKSNYLPAEHNKYEEAIKELSPTEKIAYGEAVGKIENKYGTFIFTATDTEWEGGYRSPTYSVMWTHDGKSEILTRLKINELIQLIEKGKIEEDKK